MIKPELKPSGGGGSTGSNCFGVAELGRQQIMPFSFYPIFRVAGKIFLLSLLCILGASGLLYAFFQIGQSRLREIDKREKEELKTVFSKAIIDGAVANPPTPSNAFVVTSRHGNDPYTIWFTNSTGQRDGYFVSKNFPERNAWKFKSLSTPSQAFTRERQTNQ